MLIFNILDLFHNFRLQTNQPVNILHGLKLSGDAPLL